MTPSELLTQAADLIRDRAAHFATYQADLLLPSGRKRFDTPLEEWMYWNTERNGSDDALAWIELLNPAVAPALEQTLRAARGMWRVYENRDWPRAKVESHVGAEHLAALALAKALLGTREEEK